MKITDVQTIRLRAAIPADGQVFSRSGVRSTRSTTLVRVDTDEGISGIGSASGNGELIEVIVAKVIKPLLVGMDPTEIDAIWDRVYVRGSVATKFQFMPRRFIPKNLRRSLGARSVLPIRGFTA